MKKETLEEFNSHFNCKQNWEKEFDKKINSYDKDDGFIIYVEGYDNQDFDIALIKDFISTLMERQRTFYENKKR